QERHGHLGLAEIQRLAGLGGEPLFDALLVFENYPKSGETSRFAGLPVTDLRARDTSHYPLSLAVLTEGEGAERLSLCLGYRRDRLDAAQAHRLLARLDSLLGALAARPDSSLGRLDALLPGETELLERFGAGAAAPAEP